MAENQRLNPDFLAFSQDYSRTMNEVIRPALREACQTVPAQGAGGIPLHMERYDAPQARGTVVVLHGFTENAAKFAETIFSLWKNGFCVLAFDQRGHGFSWRYPSVSDLSLTHVDRFDRYVEDLEAVVGSQLSVMPRPWHLFCHSMGGAVAALYMERHPDTFARAALCAPMIAPSTGGVPLPVSLLICDGAALAGKSDKRMFISKPYSGPEDFATSCASCRERFQWYDDLKAATPAYQNNGGTFGWVGNALKVTRQILKSGQPEKIRTKVRLYSAALDNTVLPGPQKTFAGRLPDGSFQVVANAKHEIYRSEDSVLFPWWHDVLAFLKG